MKIYDFQVGVVRYIFPNLLPALIGQTAAEAHHTPLKYLQMRIIIFDPLQVGFEAVFISDRRLVAVHSCCGFSTAS